MCTPQIVASQLDVDKLDYLLRDVLRVYGRDVMKQLHDLFISLIKSSRVSEFAVCTMQHVTSCLQSCTSWYDCIVSCASVYE